MSNTAARLLLMAALDGGSFSPPATIDDPTLAAPSFYSPRTQLTTPTYDGSGQATHASVVKIPGGWNGHLYWMAFTPYPAADNTKENPSILVSNDGTTWAVPAGLTNPVVAKPASAFNSDPDLVYHGGILFLFYREVGTGIGTGESICLTWSNDGITWTTPIVVITNDPALHRTLSPAVLRREDGTWHMWTTDIIPSPNTLEHWTASDPEGPWTSSVATAAITGRDIWHQDVVWDGSAYRMFQFDAELGMTAGVGTVKLGSSTDGETWTFGSTVLSGSGGANWDSDYTYRGSGLFEDARYRLWYGGVHGTTWHLGYTEVDPSDFP